jgi:YD repeat-containing protein
MRHRGYWTSRILAAAAVAVATAAAMAAETLSYSYDAKGRLVKVVQSGGGAATNTVTNYSYDKADNRTALKVTGPPNPPPP